MQVLLGGRTPVAGGALTVDDTHEWPFRRDVTPRLTVAPPAIHIRNLHLAFPSGQSAGTRLVLTQSTYQLQRWLDFALAHPGVMLTADANGRALRQRAPEAFARRGPWSRIEILETRDDEPSDDGEASALHAAFLQPDPVRRHDVIAHVVEQHPRDPAILLALGSASMERRDVQTALDAVEAAVELAADWEAPYFELGKVWLRADDTARAAAAFAEAARLMPTFATAWSNLGAALGELERRAEAIEALQRALELDPNGHPTLNNLGIALRELGRFDAAEAALRRVVELAPGFVFGRYNLAHTLWLAGNHREALVTYEEAFARDPQQSPRQACRLAVARAAAGDGDGAVSAMRQGIEQLTGAPLAQALAEAEQALSGVLSGHERAVAQLLRVVRTARGMIEGPGYSS